MEKELELKPGEVVFFPHLARDMTLRDHFAGLALQAYMAVSLGREVNEVTSTREEILTLYARNAYDFADKMMEARRG